MWAFEQRCSLEYEFNDLINYFLVIDEVKLANSTRDLIDA
jgi:hypothetical protein